MSKSLGNYFTIQEILENNDAVALRQFFLGSHYRSPMDFSTEGLHEAGKASERIYETLERAGRAADSARDATPDAPLLDDFRREMDDDFNTPRALALIFDEVRSLNRLLDDKKIERVPARAAALKVLCEALGLLHGPPNAFFSRKKERWLKQQGLAREQVEARIAERNQARKEKKWQEADRIRQELLDKGVMIEDTASGTEWKIK
jgi:cysteinyl-tRNA synthetase